MVFFKIQIWLFIPKGPYDFNIALHSLRWWLAWTDYDLDHRRSFQYKDPVLTEFPLRKWDGFTTVFTMGSYTLRTVFILKIPPGIKTASL